MIPANRRNAARLFPVVVLGVLMLVGTSTLAGAAPSKASAAKISAHLTKKSFTKAQAKKVKLIYKFSAPSKSFAYRLSFKKGSKWQKIKSVKRKGTFKGSHKITVKKLFRGKPVKVGRYRLKLSADGGSKLLGFKVKGSKPANTALPTISGTTTQGQKLTASNGSWSHSPTSYAYQWRRCDGSGASCADISGATSSSYVLVLTDVNSTIRVVVTASNSYGSASATSGKTAVVSGLPPANTALPTISGTTTQGQILTASHGSWDNLPTSYAYKWRRCDNSGASCSDISSATSGSYTLVLADVAHTIRVVVTASSSYGSASATSGQTVVVAGLPPANTALPTISGTTTQGQTLTASNGSWNNSPTSYAYQWRRCNSAGSACVDIAGATSSSYTLVYADAASTIRVVVTATNSNGSTSATSSQTAVVVGLPPANTALPTISGTTTQGNKLTAGNGPWNNSPTSYAYQWRRCNGSGASCADISSATSSSYTLVPADVGSTIRVVVTASNSYGSASATSSQTAVVKPPPIVTTVDAGAYHSCAFASSGTVKCWGRNTDGQLGDGTSDDSPIPVQVSGITTATTISAGDSHTCALLTGGTIECWGNNSSGQLGDGTGIGSSTPVQVSGITTATQVSAGDDHTCALLSGGTIECWGRNTYGQLGDGTSDDSPIPVQVSGITTATAISAGGAHTCALLSGGAIKCWGNSEYGQLGNGLFGPGSWSPTPVQVSGITTATTISAGDDHTCALLSGGTIECWGRNTYGQLGDGTTAPSATPVQVSGITTATQVSAGYERTCARLSGGTVKCWGYNSSGQFGNGSSDYDPHPLPVTVSGITTATQVSAGDDHTCALLSGGTVECWGNSYYGQLGNGEISDISDHSSIPVQVNGITTATTISAGDDHTCALLSGGTIECWGRNTYGQLGDGSSDYDPYPLPVTVSGITTATQVSAGDDHTCALLSGGTVKCWGDNSSGQLGNGSSDYDPHPLSVTVSGITTATQVSAGDSHTCALLSDHTVRCWGDNYYGQLGNGADGYDASSQAPVVVSGITTATAISAGGAHTCALLSGGAIKCWGNSEYGQLGNGLFDSGSSSPTPVQVSGITTATTISAGDSHTCALLSGGTIKCWGYNGDGELGNGTNDPSSIPVQVSGITTATTISAGGLHTCALLSDGKVMCWGRNTSGQLGNGMYGYNIVSLIPVQVSGITTATAISAGSSHSCAVLSSGAVKCWGYSEYGQLGDGVYDSHSMIPINVVGLP